MPETRRIDNTRPAHTAVWVAALLIAAFLGVALGAAAPARVAVTPPPGATALAAQRPAAARAARVPQVPAEPGRGYVPISEEPELGAAPAFPVAAGVEASEPAAAEPRRERAVGVSLQRASGPPLLAVRRGSGRIVFHALERAGTDGAGLEGEWAVAGECGERLRLDLAQPARGAGAPRGVGGELSSSGGWRTAVAIPVQECAARRVLIGRSPTPVDRERFSGFSSDELRQVATTEGAAWLVFGGPGRSRAAVVVRRDGAWREAWSRETDGMQEILAVLRRGDDWEGLFVTLRGDTPDALQRVRVSGGGAHPDAPASLRG